MGSIAAAMRLNQYYECFKTWLGRHNMAKSCMVMFGGFRNVDQEWIRRVLNCKLRDGHPSVPRTAFPGPWIALHRPVRRILELLSFPRGGEINPESDASSLGGSNQLIRCR